jgi:hypothetical protein
VTRQNPDNKKWERFMETLTVTLTGTDEQIASALEDLARRIRIWTVDLDVGGHAPMAHRGNDKVAKYLAIFSDWED